MKLRLTAAEESATAPSAASSWWIRPARPRGFPKSLATWRTMTGAHRVIRGAFVKLMHEETLEDVEPLEESNAFWHALQKQYQVSKLLAQ